MKQYKFALAERQLSQYITLCMYMAMLPHGGGVCMGSAAELSSLTVFMA